MHTFNPKVLKKGNENLRRSTEFNSNRRLPYSNAYLSLNIETWINISVLMPQNKAKLNTSYQKAKIWQEWQLHTTFETKNNLVKFSNLIIFNGNQLC